MAEHDQRIGTLRGVEVRRERQPALDRGAVLAGPLQPLCLWDRQLRDEVLVEVRQTSLVGAVDVRRVEIAGRIVRSDDIGDCREGLVDGEVLQPARPLRHLLDPGAGRRSDAEEMNLASSFGGEIEEAAVGGPARIGRLESPRRGQIDRLAGAVRRTDVEVARSAMIQLLLDDHVGAERAHVGQVLTVRREVDVAVHRAVVGQSRDLSLRRHGPEIGVVVLQSRRGTRGRR